MTYDIAFLIIRVVVGLLLAAHGAQKLFGWWGGPGIAGFTSWMDKMGMRPAPFWAWMGGLSEFGGGLLFALGFLSPLGSLGIISAMLVATIKAHWQNGLWAAKGGYEFTLTNLVIALGLAITGPGAYSLDSVLGIAFPQPVTLIGGLVLVLVGVAAALLGQSRDQVTA